jgi:hypothetical protein
MPDTIGYDNTITTPCRGQNTLSNISVNTAMRPIDWTFYITVFDGIVMNIINVIAEILFITNPMFPKTPLPYRLLAFISRSQALAHCH